MYSSIEGGGRGLVSLFKCLRENKIYT